MFSKAVIIFSALHCSTMIQSAECRGTLEVHNISCYKYTERVKSFGCEFLKFAGGRYGLSVRMMLDRDMDKTLRVRLLLDISPNKSKKVMRLLDVKLNICTLLQQLTTNQFLKTILIEFKRTSNLPTHCPIRGNILYGSDNYTVTDDYLPPTAPLFNFTFTAELYDKNKLFGGWQILGASVPKTNRK